ncbi:hypothetical protein [Streptomyces sp. NBC_00046]|uniref:hypothetical protein n=1 Tax=unclassified Streptomyces TaxID=2593676 RepID=UPI00324D91AA
MAVDGELVGHVYRIRRTWHAIGLSEKYATSHTSRAAAATRLVALIDMRAAAEADVARKMRRRTEAPPGWRFTTWDVVGPGDIVRTPVRCRPVRGASLADSPLYPEVWGVPVTLTGVDYLSNGAVVSRGKEEGAPAWSGMGVLLSTPEFAEVGILVPAATPAATPAEATRERAPPVGRRPGRGGRRRVLFPFRERGVGVCVALTHAADLREQRLSESTLGNLLGNPLRNLLSNRQAR